MEAFVKNLLMHQSFTWRSLLSVSVQGERTYAAPVNINGYEVHKLKFITTIAGDKITSQTHIFIDEFLAPQVKAGDMIKTKSGDYIVLTHEYFYTENGVLDYGVIYL